MINVHSLRSYRGSSEGVLGGLSLRGLHEIMEESTGHSSGERDDERTPFSNSWAGDECESESSGSEWV